MNSIHQAANLISNASAILITAGAGMGVDSGLPDFRGDEGFWNAYPPFRHLGLGFIDMAQPRWFRSDPTLAWGFYGHRFKLYRDTTPHSGFDLILSWIKRFSLSSFVYTSNVDGHFQQAGFNPQQIVECHGSLQFAQCIKPCCKDIWPLESLPCDINMKQCRADGPLPKCPNCDQISRPNILLFGDYFWLHDRVTAQEKRFHHWFSNNQKKSLVVLEMGAGSTLPTIRQLGEELFCDHQASLIRINPRESEGPLGTISITGNALESLKKIDHKLK